MKNVHFLAVCAAFGCATVFADAPFVKTPPFLQDAGTDHFAVVLETAAEDKMLALEVCETAGGTSAQFGANCSTVGSRVVPYAFTKCPFAADSYKAVATATDLKEGTAYAWRVMRGGAVVGQGAFTTWRTAEDDFSCGVWGDYQTGLTPSDWELDKYRAGEMMFRDMLARKLDFGVTTGDMADRGLYQEEMRPLILDRTCGVLGAKIPFFTAWGNHDTRFPQNHFFLHNPKGEGGSFAFFRNGCLFICMDHADMGNDKVDGSLAVRAWLEGVLKTPEAQKARFKFAFQHVPVYVEEFGNCSRWVLDLYLKYGIDAVFSGDHHGYNRIERGGILQIVNGCFGYFGKKDDFVNWYGDEVKVGGHKGMPNAPKWRRQAPGRPGVLGEPTSVGQGLFPGYGVLAVHGDEATWTQLVFNADGSYAGVADKITITSRRGRPPRAIPPLGMATEYFCFSKQDDPKSALKFTLTGKGGAQLELIDFGARVVGFRVPDGKGGYDVKREAPKTFRECLDRWPDSESFCGETFHDGDVVGVRFYRKKELVKTVELLPDNTWR